ELSQLYAAQADEADSELPDPVRYRDVAPAAGEQPADDGYWTDALDAAPLTLALPWEAAGSLPNPSPRGQRELRLPSKLGEGLEDLAQGESIGSFVLFLSAFYALLHRYSDETDLVVVSPDANRPREGLDAVIGPFARNLPLRLRIDGDPSFRELLRLSRDAYLGGAGHADAAPPYLNRLMEADGP